MRQSVLLLPCVAGLSCAAGLAGLLTTAACAPAGSSAGQLARLEKRSGGRLGVAALDTAGGRGLGYRADERFPMCSTFKVVLAAAVLHRVDRKEESLERVVPFQETDVLEYAPAVRLRLPEKAMAVSDLCAAAVEISDNTAANLLLESVGGPPGLTRFARSIGDTVTRLDRNEPDLNAATPGDARDTTSPAAMLTTMRKLLLGPALSPSSRARLEKWMRQCVTGRKRLRAGVPATWGAADKTGTGDNGSSGDVGIFRPPGRSPVLIAAYVTASPLPPYEREMILAEVGRLVTAQFAR